MEQEIKLIDYCDIGVVQTKDMNDEQIKELVNNLQEFAKSSGVTIITAKQPTRHIEENKIPNPEDISESQMITTNTNNGVGIVSNNTINIGIEEGEVCNRNGCGGIIIRPIDNCSCHINPPCSACVDAVAKCPKCGWEEKEREAKTVKMTQEEKYYWKKDQDRWREEYTRPLDNTKISYRVLAHTHFTQICEGVYPEGTTQDEVRVVVNGTFGGRFDYFENGKFKFVAYTD